MGLPVDSVRQQPGLASRRRLDRVGDRIFYLLTALAAFATLALIGTIVYKIVEGAWPSVRHFGLGFLWTSTWDPVHAQFGALQFIAGTAVTSFGAVLLAAPVSIAIALFLSELAPPAVRGPIGTLIDMLAAVPSVVIGLWGIFVVAPFMAQDVEPFLHRWLGFIPIFGGSPTQSSVFTAIVVLTVMVIPITSAICRELFIAVPRDLEEAALALGATRWEMIRGVVLQYARGGVVAAIMLGLGRALGEAIAVTQVIGNFVPLKLSLFSPGDTLASRIANQYQGADTNLALHSLIYLGLILLAITLVTNVVAQRVVHRFDVNRARSVSQASQPISFAAVGRTRRRKAVNRFVEGLAIVAALSAIAVLALMVGSVFVRGYHALSIGFFTHNPATFGVSGGGIAPAFVGTILLISLATAMALPVGVLLAIYVSEFAPRRLGDQARLWLDVLNGFPSIVIGIFVFTLLVAGRGQSGYAGAFALAIIMLPLVSRTTLEMLALVPNSLRDASYSLGISRWRTVLGVVLPGAMGGSSPERSSPSPAQPARPRRSCSRRRSRRRSSPGTPTRPWLRFP